MSQKFQRVRGTRDMLGQESLAFRYIESQAFQIAQYYGFQEIETPMFEFSEVFHRTLGETSDVVSKETYTFTDRGGDNITLRPEGTAGVARAFVSEGMAQNLPLKFYYSGPMFRYERPQKGRYRQFNQIGVEMLGFENPQADIECIAMAWQLLNEIGIAQKCQLEINTLGDIESRHQYREILVHYLEKFKDQLSPDSQIRLQKNPMRILDSKDDGDRRIVSGAPQMQESLNQHSKDFFAQVIDGIEKLGIPVKVNQKLVRGLDYYCHTVFEFTTTELGAQGTVLAGGRYDGLIEMMGGQKTPGVGWASGVERLMELVPSEKLPASPRLITLIAADTAGESECLKLAFELRQKKMTVENLIGNGHVGKKMKRANKLNADFAIIIGETEIASGVFAVKNLKTGEQKNIQRGEWSILTNE